MTRCPKSGSGCGVCVVQGSFNDHAVPWNCSCSASLVRREMPSGPHLLSVGVAGAREP